MHYLILDHIYFHMNKSFPHDACDFSPINHHVVIRTEFFCWLVGFFVLYTSVSVFLGCLVLTWKGSDVKTTFSLGLHHFFGSFHINIMLPQNTPWIEAEWFEHPLQSKPNLFEKY